MSVGRDSFLSQDFTQAAAGEMPETAYTNGSYLASNPTWHVEDSLWKTCQILQMVRQNHLGPKTICEVGCGAGEILAQLQRNMPEDCTFSGYDISPQAIALCGERANEKLRFFCRDILREKEVFFDLIMLIDLIEHLQDYPSFLTEVKSKAEYKILHIPLELSVQTVARGHPILHYRRAVGHLHFFTKDMAIQILKDLGYEIVDWFYTASSIEAPSKSLKSSLFRWPRRLFFALHEDLAVRILGGYSMMVLGR